MPRTNRIRSHSIYGTSGTYGSYVQGPHLSRTDYMSDSHGRPVVDSAMYLQETYHNPVRVKGVHNGNVVTDFVPDLWEPGGTTDVLSYPPLSEMVTAALSRSNPNRRAIDMPAFWFEFLSEVPKAIYEIGLDLIKHAERLGRPPRRTDHVNVKVSRFQKLVNRGADDNLAVQFGWIPLISDLSKIIDFSNIVEKRVAELNRLRDSGGMRRRLSLYTASEDLFYPNNWVLQANTFHLEAKLSRHLRAEVWATLRWQLDNPMNFPTRPDSVRKLAAGLASGTKDGDFWKLNVDLASIWEVIPFSWLADYFTNIGDYTSAFRNELPVHASNMCVMYRLSNVTNLHSAVFSGAGTEGLSATNGTSVHTRKSRDVFPTPTPLFSASVGFLNLQQWSILGSLIVPKLLKG